MIASAAPRARVLLVLLSLLAAAPGCGPSKEQLAELARLDQAADDLARTNTEAWKKAMATAKETAVPRPDLGKCEVDIGAPRMGALAHVEKILGPGALEPEPVAVVPAAKLSEATSGRARRIAWNRKALANRTDRYQNMLFQERLQAARDLASEKAWTWDVTIVLDVDIGARVEDGKADTFQGGARMGRVYVYDYQKQRIACAGVFLAQSSDTVHFTQRKGDKHGGKDEIEVDLEDQMYQEAWKSVQAAGPRPAGAAGEGKAPATAAPR